MLDRLTIERMEAAGEGPILVALSGGGDSVALLHLLKERFGAARLRAAVVDHKLRGGSAQDAQRAADIAMSLGVWARIFPLTWSDAGPRGHEAARAYRYAVLCEVARDVGAGVIVTGHTRDDQAETVLIRASRGSGMRGLAGMRAWTPMPFWPQGRGLWLARPLLGARRTALRDALRSAGLDWIEDPSNLDEKYARVRARALLGAMDDHDSMRFAALAERLRPIVDEIDKLAADLIADAATFNEDEIQVERVRWLGAAEVRQRALDVLIIAASGDDRGPAVAQLEALSSALDRSDFSGATLAGAWLQPRGQRVVIQRDPGGLAGRAGGAEPIAPLALSPGREVVWDGRLAVTAREKGWSVVVEDGEPMLAKGEARAPLSSVQARWLLRERVDHLLARS